MNSVVNIESIVNLIKKIYSENDRNVDIASKYLFNQKDREKVIFVLKDIQSISRELKNITKDSIIDIYSNNLPIKSTSNNLNILEIENKRFKNFISLLEESLNIINKHMIRYKLDESYIYNGNDFSKKQIIDFNNITEEDVFSRNIIKLKNIASYMFDRISNKEDPIGIIALNESKKIYQTCSNIKYLSDTATFEVLESSIEKLDYSITTLKEQIYIYKDKKGQNKEIYNFFNNILSNLLDIYNEITTFSRKKVFNFLIQDLTNLFKEKNEEVYNLDMYYIKKYEIKNFLSRLNVSPEQKYFLQLFFKSPLFSKDIFCSINISDIKDYLGKNENKVSDHNKIKNIADILKDNMGIYSKFVKDIPDLINKILNILKGKDIVLSSNINIILDNIFAEIFDKFWIENNFVYQEINTITLLKNLIESLNDSISIIQGDRREVLLFSFIKELLKISNEKFDSSIQLNNIFEEENLKNEALKNYDHKKQEKKYIMDNLKLSLKNKKKELTTLLESIEASIKENARGKKDVPYNIKKVPLSKITGTLIENSLPEQINNSEYKKEILLDPKKTYENKITQTFFGLGDLKSEIQEALRQAQKINEEKNKN